MLHYFPFSASLTMIHKNFAHILYLYQWIYVFIYMYFIYNIFYIHSDQLINLSIIYLEIVIYCNYNYNLINKYNCNINNNFCFNFFIFIEFLYFNFIVIIKRKINKEKFISTKIFSYFIQTWEIFFFRHKEYTRITCIKDILRHQIFINDTYISIYILIYNI